MSGDIDLSGARAAFVVESRELLDDMEQALLALERDGPSALETHIGAIFRAAHTIKGTSGLFGFDALVRFTHVTESLLDELRSGKTAFEDPVTSLLLASLDVMRGLIDHLDDDDGLVLPADAQALMQRMDAHRAAARSSAEAHAGTGHAPAAAAPSATPAAVRTADDETLVIVQWHLALRPAADCLANGFDPASVIAWLQTQTEIAALVPVDGALPSLAAMDAEHCYLGFDVALAAMDAGGMIDEALEFHRDGSTIAILGPESTLTDAVAFVRTLGEAPAEVVDRLVRCGTLDASGAHRLQAALDGAAQDARVPAGPARDAGDAKTGAAPAGIAARATAPASAPTAAAGSQGAGDKRVLRVSAERLDGLVDLLGELVIANASACNIAESTANPRMVEAMEHLAMLVESVRERALQLRMVAIGETFARFQRVVRDVSRELGKDIRLEISGGDTELDKAMVERINDPLLHLVRNAIDHGIGSPELRLGVGKPAHGQLRLSAYHEGGLVVIEVADDGKGLDAMQIRAKAIERGLIAADAQLTDSELHQLIFEPGFSTAAKVTDLSGRGVGMDVVRRNVQALRGTIRLHSEPGRGTRVQIRLPLTLAIIDGFVVGVGDARFVMPLESVVECLDLPADCPLDCIDLRGSVLPLLHLAEQFGVRAAAHARRSIVVTQFGDQRAGIVVDRLLGEQQTVIKPLGRLFERLPGVGGSTILGDGSIALVLDAGALLGQAVQLHDRRWTTVGAHDASRQTEPGATATEA